MLQPENDTAFVFGCGFLGFRVAKQLVEQGWRVGTVTRSPEKAENFRRCGIDTLVGDWLDTRLCARVWPASRVLFAVGYDPRSRYSRHEVYVEGLKNVLPYVHADSDVVYISTTGVFHQSGHQWVDERSPAKPRREGGQAHLRAEKRLRFHRAKVAGRTTVLRLAGIYGPGRIPNVAAIAREEPLSVDPESYLNLIHVDDAARCVMAAWQAEQVLGLYVVADGHPVRRGDYYAEVARLAGAAPPRFADTAGGPASKRAEGSKRVWTRAMQRDLLPRCAFPSYWEGLRATLGSVQ